MESNGALKLLAPNRFVVDWVNANLLSRLGELLRDECVEAMRRSSRSRSARAADRLRGVAGTGSRAPRARQAQPKAWSSASA